MYIHSELYEDKTTRDNLYYALRKRGIDAYRSTCKGLNLHPAYVTDTTHPGKHENGFGNPWYDTYWPVLYKLEWND